MEAKLDEDGSARRLGYSAVSVSRFLFFTLTAVTVVIEIAAIGPWGDHRVAGDLMATLLLLPILVAWAIGPYAVANKFAHEFENLLGWAFVGLQVIMAVPALWIYAEAFFIAQGVDPQLGLIFIIVPIYQFLAVFVVYYVLRLWTRHRG